MWIAGHALLFPALAGLATGLVVGDHELTVGVELEPVDDPADDHAVGGLGGDAQLDTEHGDVARVFHLEVAAEEHLGVGVERRPLLVGELELGELGVGGELLGRPGRGRASAASIVRSAGGRHIRCWSARCTSVPLLAGADGGSGSRSM